MVLSNQLFRDAGNIKEMMDIIDTDNFHIVSLLKFL